MPSLNPQSAIRNPQSAVRLSRVSYQLPDGHRLVNDIDLELAAGETLVLVGRSGSGKTTILKLINALLAATSGEIEVLGKRSREWDPISLRRKIGYVIQEVGAVPAFHGGGQRRIGSPAGGMARRKNSGAQPGNAGACGPRSGAVPATLPEPALRRAAPARGRGARPRSRPAAMLLDEPFGALDPLTRSEIQVEFRSLKQRLKKTMIFVTHDVREALILGDRIGLVRDGVLARISAARDFLGSDDPEVSAYRKSLEAL